MLPRIKQWGAKGVKLDFMESDSQDRYQWYDAVLAEDGRPAPDGQLPRLHHPARPRADVAARDDDGSRARRGELPARGRTTRSSSSPATSPARWTTRRCRSRSARKEASVAHEVALPVVYESGWTHFADKPEAYERHPQALRYLDQVPTVWDETRLLGGDPDSRRRGRAPQRRPLVRRRASPAGTRTTPRRRSGSSAAGSGWSRPSAMRRAGSRRRRPGQPGAARSRTPSRWPCKRNGGFAAVICRYRPGLQTCDQPITAGPGHARLTITPAQVDAAEGLVLRGDRRRSPTRPTSGTWCPAAAPPPGWTVTGPAVRRAPGSRAGETISGPLDRAGRRRRSAGFTDVPVFAEFLVGGVHVEQAVKAFVPPPTPTDAVQVSDLPFMSETNGWGPVERDRSNGENTGGDGNALTIGGVDLRQGTSARTRRPRCRSTSAAAAGLHRDDRPRRRDRPSPARSRSRSSATTDRCTTAESWRARARRYRSTVDISDVRMLSLRVTDGGDGRNFDHADWAEAALTC